MKVKVGTKLYDAEIESVMLILSAQDKVNIATMAPSATKYCAFPEGMSEEEAKLFMELVCDKTFSSCSRQQ